MTTHDGAARPGSRRAAVRDREDAAVTRLQQLAADLDDAPVFMAPTAFLLKYEEERWPAVRFSDVKDYQKRVAA